MLSSSMFWFVSFDTTEADFLRYIPWTDEAQEVTACGIPIAYNASKEWVGKKVVLFSVPGAFTPTCSERHLPGYIERLSDLKAKGVDIVAVVASNDPFVMSAWGKANGIKDEIVRLIPCNSNIHTN